MEEQNVTVWTSVNNKKKKKINQKYFANQSLNEEKNDTASSLQSSWSIIESQNINTREQEIDNGETIKFDKKYVLWSHDVFNKDWSLKSYEKIISIENVSQFWKIFNNLNKLSFKTNNLFIMKDDTEPIWEHENNRKGGICSLRVEINEALKIFEELCIYMVCNKLVMNMEEINGISFSPRNSWAIIKIWNKHKDQDISQLLNQDLKNKYKDISIKYKSNEPEY